MSILTNMMKSQFQSYSGKAKLFKKIGALLRNNWQVVDIFEYLVGKHDSGGDIGRHMNPEYHFLKNALDVMSRAGTLPDAFEGWVSATELVIIKTGEKTGAYEQALQQCIDLDTEVSTIIKTVKKSLITPVFALVILVGLLVGAKSSMMPILEDLVPMNRWPDIALSFYDISTAVGENPSQTFGIMFGIAFFIKWSTPNLVIPAVPKFRNFLDKVFMPYSIYKAMQISIFLKSLSSLLVAGVRFRDALELIEHSSNKYMKVHVSEMLKKVTQAENSATVFESEFLGHYGEDLSAMARGDNLEGALNDVATDCMKEVTEDLPAKMGFIGTLCMVSIIGVVIFGLLAFYEIVGILQSGDI
ncbi:conserved membrane hypothetical protein [Vibrio chagasii]|nr:conserved membrane hypothetical protein [Vibrio chagasii]